MRISIMNIDNKKPAPRLDAQRTNQQRRKLIHTVWATPIVTSVTLPAHGQTSDAPRTELSPCDWNTQNWQDLNASEQSLWGALGWNENSWTNGPPPPSNTMFWGDLSGAETNALTQLGFTQNDWDNFDDICGT